MRNNPIIVQKYGGACLETSAKIRAVASSLADLHIHRHQKPNATAILVIRACHQNNRGRAALIERR
jgi:aspartokinase